MTLSSIFEKHQQAFLKNPYPLISQRREILLNLKRLLQEQAPSLDKAINKDFSHRAQEETLFLEIFPTIKAIDYCVKHLKKWTKSQQRSVPWYLKPSQASVIAQPLGVIGIIVPWNYPIYLSLVPMIYALAAGNHVMIKFSELTPATNKALTGLLKKSLLKHVVTPVEGDAEFAKAFSTLPFGHLLFTGSTVVGKKIMAAASKNLTPVTLELGGKSPAIISTTINPDYFDRLFMGKLFNAGQTCVAPDYLLIPKNSEPLIENQLTAFINRRYPNLIKNIHYTSIINDIHKKRLEHLLKDAREKGARIVQFGEDEQAGNKMPVYLIFNTQPSMQVMQEEIFGPILPVIAYDNFQQAIALVKTLPNPLALYYFGKSKDEINQLTFNTLSGALIINETLMHIANDDLPFGGVGQSGLGQYHGKEGFMTFSKLKPIFKQRKISPVSWFYPPYGKLIRGFIRYIAGIKIKEKL